MSPSRPRFRTRVGDLLIDALGFYTPETGHSSGGKHLHEWCQQNHLNPLDLYIAQNVIAVSKTDCIEH